MTDLAPVQPSPLEQPKSMKAVDWEGVPESVSTIDTDVPRVRNPLDGVIRLTSAGICGTDMHVFRGRYPADPPLTLGHEVIGIVEAIGDGVFHLKVGDRVVIFFCISCGFCENCTRGQRGFCLHVNPKGEGEAIGIPYGGRQLNGGQAQFVRIPHVEESALVLPPGKEHELDYLPLADIWPTAWTGLDWAGFEACDTVAVWGAGPVGLLCAYSALLRGASRVYVIDNVPSRLYIAQSIGAIPIDFSSNSPVEEIKKKDPEGVMRSVDCCGYECVDKTGKNVITTILNEMINATRNGGGIGIIGPYETVDPFAPTAAEKKGHLTIDFGTLWSNSISLKGGPAVDPELRFKLKDYIESGKANPSFVWGKEIRIEEAPATYREFSEHKILKPVIIFPDGQD